MVLLSYYGPAATKLCAILLVENISWGAQTCFFSNVFYPVICNDYETVVLSLNSSSWSRWEAEAETRGEFRAPDEAYDLNSSLHASSNPDASTLPTGSASTVPSPSASCRAEADDALCWPPGIPNVAVHATFWSRHLEGQWKQLDLWRWREIWLGL